ncbi:hypothetical protein BDR05DRAFT_975955 [Suillus weaverae]|nr:hypothetical protein BDR05DRAFT_975955 [Suillus weaverae]
MAAFKSHMAHYKGPELRCVEPSLAPGEAEVVAVWHNECCFHANDYKMQAYLLPGRIIHVSGFIDGEVIEEARKIIYPGVNSSDDWWDTAQLLAQMKDAIYVLHAFNMNKSNGGKQQHQHDTTIPQSNPVAEHHGKPQKMTLPDGRPKGLQQVLKEWGFDVQKMRAKCAPYWGWCKYCYREVPKKTLDDAKCCVQEQLDACPVDVIQWFINRSWHLMSAFSWKQRQHRQVLQCAMMLIEVVLGSA